MTSDISRYRTKPSMTTLAVTNHPLAFNNEIQHSGNTSEVCDNDAHKIGAIGEAVMTTDTDLNKTGNIEDEDFEVHKQTSMDGAKSQILSNDIRSKAASKDNNASLNSDVQTSSVLNAYTHQSDLHVEGDVGTSELNFDGNFSLLNPLKDGNGDLKRDSAIEATPKLRATISSKTSSKDACSEGKILTKDCNVGCQSQILVKDVGVEVKRSHKDAENCSQRLSKDGQNEAQKSSKNLVVHKLRKDDEIPSQRLNKNAAEVISRSKDTEVSKVGSQNLREDPEISCHKKDTDIDLQTNATKCEVESTKQDIPNINNETECRQPKNIYGTDKNKLMTNQELTRKINASEEITTGRVKTIGDKKQSKDDDFSSKKLTKDRLTNVLGKALSHSSEFDKKSSSTANIGVHFVKSTGSCESFDNLRFTYSKADNVVSMTSDIISEELPSSVNKDSSENLEESINEENDSVLSDQSFDETPSKTNNVPRSDKKKKMSVWYNMLNPTYKSRHEEYKRIFKDIPKNDRLIVDYACALQKNIIVQGRLYISQYWVCFYANIFGVETSMMLQFKDIIQITKERTARVFANAIQISTAEEKFFVTSLNARDKTYVVISHIWQYVTSEKYMSDNELWNLIHYCYGDDLGFDPEDKDYVRLSQDDRAEFQSRFQIEEFVSQSCDSVGIRDKDVKLDENELLNNKAILTELITSSAAGDIASIFTDDTDTEMELLCSGHDHYNLEIVNDVFNCSVDTLFQYCFTDSKVFSDFIAARKTLDLIQSEWPSEADENGFRTRSLSYVVSLSLAVGPKTAPTIEKQIMFPDSKPGYFYLIDAECQTNGIPYGENFCVINRYCLSRVGESQSRLRITSHIKYHKSIWSVVKSFIDKNATTGILETFRVFVEILREESGGPAKSKPFKKLKKRSTLSTPLLPETSKVDIMTASSNAWLSRNMLVKILLSVMVCMILSNAVLLYKLWTHQPSMFEGVYQHCTQSPQSCPNDWQMTLNKEYLKHMAEIDHWKQTVINVIQLTDKMKDSLTSLLESLNKHH